MSESRRWVKIKEFKVIDDKGEVYVIERYDEHMVEYEELEVPSREWPDPIGWSGFSLNA